MPKARVNLSDVNMFNHSVNQATFIVKEARSNFNSYCQTLIDKINQEETSLNNLLKDINQKVKQIERLLSEKETNLQSLQSMLASTPRYITSKTTDSEGNTHEEKRENPRYQQLLMEIENVKEKISKLKSLQIDASNIKLKINEQITLIKSTRVQVENSKHEFSQSIDNINLISSNANNRLNSIASTIEEYLNINLLFSE